MAQLDVQAEASGSFLSEQLSELPAREEALPWPLEESGLAQRYYT